MLCIPFERPSNTKKSVSIRGLKTGFYNDLILGGPGRTRTCDQPVLSSECSVGLAGLEMVYITLKNRSCGRYDYYAYCIIYCKIIHVGWSESFHFDLLYHNRKGPIQVGCTKETSTALLFWLKIFYPCFDIFSFPQRFAPYLDGLWKFSSFD